MESLKSLISAIRALFEGVDGRLEGVQQSLKKLWSWVNGLAWVAESETIERLPLTTVHFEGTVEAGTEDILFNVLGQSIDTRGLVSGEQYTVYFDGAPHQMYYCEETFSGQSVKYFAAAPDILSALLPGVFTLICGLSETDASVWAAAIHAEEGEHDEDHTFYIPPETMPKEKLPNEFLDAAWVAADPGQPIWADSTEARANDDGSVGYFISGSGSEIDMVVGETYTFIIDGMKYTGIAAEGYASFGEVYIGNPLYSELALHSDTAEDVEDNGDDYCLRTRTNGSGWKLRNGTAGHTYTWEVYKGDKPAQLPMRYTPESVAKSVGELRGTVKGQAEEIGLLRSASFGWSEYGTTYDGHKALRVKTTYPQKGFPGGVFYLRETAYVTESSFDTLEDYLAFENPEKLYAISPSNWRDILRRPGLTTASVNNTAGTVTFSQKGGATSARFERCTFGGSSLSYYTLYGQENSTTRGEEWFVVQYDLSKIVQDPRPIQFFAQGNQVSREYAVSVVNGELAQSGVSVNCLIHLVWDDEAGTATAEISALDDVSEELVAHTAASERAALTSGEKLSVAFGKLAKWLSDLGALAFKSTVSKTDLDTALKEELEDAGTLDQSIVKYENDGLYTLAGVAVPISGGDGEASVAVDTALNATSENPVQNKVIAAALAETAAKTHTHAASDLTSGIVALARGGTGAGTAAEARTNLDVYSKAEVNTAITTAIGNAIAASY